MKKAISNWGKEGKNAGEEFKKVMQQIKDAPNISKATEIAIANFGQKAGSINQSSNVIEISY